MFKDGRFHAYTIQSFHKDVMAGIVVGVVALPLALAFAIASGVRPEYGLYTTIIAGFIISLLGGSKYQIGGPTGAFVPLLLGIVVTHGYESLLIAGFMAGVILTFMGIFKLGNLIHYMPRPVTIGFTTGIAVIIFSGQIAAFLGLHQLKKESTFLLQMKELINNLIHVNPYSIITAIICLITILITTKWFPKLPGALVGLILSTLVATLFFPGKVATIGTVYGGIPNEWPTFSFPAFTLEKGIELFIPAVAIAMLGGIESLLSALVADNMGNTKHHSNRELIGQGIANMVTPLFGGIPATGAIARTATNIKNGAQSPVSGIVHSLFVLLVLLAFAPLASQIPLSSMAPILMFVAWNMSERNEFVHILKSKSGDAAVLLLTFTLTVLTDLTLGVLGGIGLSVILFVIKMSKALIIQPQVASDTATLKVKSSPHSHVRVVHVEGPLFFGSAKRFMSSIQDLPDRQTLVLCMNHVPYLDATGEAIFAKLVEKCHKQGNTLLISGLNDQPRQVLQRAGWMRKIGSEHFFSQLDDALRFAEQQADIPQRAAR
ncbi:SulP family sulfate permease [Laceyella sediminis]|uniref:SulP family sulfate permease n=1 Tax=Laceyella sediminis TaxID=573074 RepID=A0ABX5EKX2_9BACL|nr:SulP family inorganic anion transporter [Laceyella sediminis]PRZ12521.1 SulP family sulfate permease [Laceyella sediminis]